MNIDRMIIAFAGSMVLVSLLLSLLHSVHWLWLTAFVGANLFQASFSGFYPLAKFLKNWGFAGIGYRFNKHTVVETGYQNQYINRPHNLRRNQMNHILSMNMF